MLALGRSPDEPAAYMLTETPDGGVTTAYSMIVKLEEISNQVASELNLTPAQVPPLCDFLDMVAGVGLGA